MGLHGGSGVDGTALRHWLAPLADTVQVVVPDLRGHGRSDRDDPAEWNLATWAEDVHQLCHVLGIERPVLLGTCSCSGNIPIRRRMHCSRGDGIQFSLGASNEPSGQPGSAEPSSPQVGSRPDVRLRPRVAPTDLRRACMSAVPQRHDSSTSAADRRPVAP
jgi:hypothetical protein